MDVKLSYESITNIKCDVIINSVGINTPVYGAICNAIIKETNSIELKQIIDGINDAYTVGDFFITDSYGLPCKKILHLITPYFKFDPKLNIYQECLRRVLNECRSRGLYRVAIPILGVGANGYDAKLAAQIISQITHSYCVFYKEMDITISTYKADIKATEQFENFERLTLNNQEIIKNKNTLKKYKTGSNLFEFNPYISYSKKYTEEYFDYDNYILGDSKVGEINPKNNCVEDYVDEYLKLREKYDKNYSGDAARKRINIFLAYGKNSSKGYMSAGSDTYLDIKTNSNPKKSDLLKLVFALRMGIDSANRFLNYYGYCFAKEAVNKEDDLVKKLIMDKQFGIVEIELAYKKNSLNSLFSKKK